MMHDKVALWEEKQNGFEILMRYNMIQGPLRNRREGLHAAERSRHESHALILFISPNIPETITRFTQLQEQDMETHSCMKNNKPNLATTFPIAMSFYEVHKNTTCTWELEWTNGSL